MFKFKWIACFTSIILLSTFITGCTENVQPYRYPSQKVTSIENQQKEVDRFVSFVDKHITDSTSKKELVELLGQGELVHELDESEIWEYRVKFDPAFKDFDAPENIAKFDFLNRKIGAELFVTIKDDKVVSTYSLHYIKPVEFEKLFNKIYLYSNSENGEYGKEQLAPYVFVNEPLTSVGYQNSEINRFRQFATQALKPGTSATDVMRFFWVAPFLAECEGLYDYWKYAVLIDPTFEMTGIPPEYAGYRNRKIGAEVIITMNKRKDAIEKFDLYYLNISENSGDSDYNTLYRFDPERQQEIIDITNK